MNTKIEKLLNELIEYFDYRIEVRSNNIVKITEQNIGRKIVFTRIRNLFSWINPRSYQFSIDQEKYEIFDKEVMEQEDFERAYAQFKLLFLNELFVLKE